MYGEICDLSLLRLGRDCRNQMSAYFLPPESFKEKPCNKPNFGAPAKNLNY